MNVNTNNEKIHIYSILLSTKRIYFLRIMYIILYLYSYNKELSKHLINYFTLLLEQITRMNLSRANVV